MSPQMSALSQPCDDDHCCSYILGSSKSTQLADANWCGDCMRKSLSPLGFSLSPLFLGGGPIPAMCPSSSGHVYLRLSALANS